MLQDASSPRWEEVLERPPLVRSTPSPPCTTCAGEGRGPDWLLVPGRDETGGHRPSQPLGHLRGHSQEGEDQNLDQDLVLWCDCGLCRSWLTATS